jgi:hypothetical protein
VAADHRLNAPTGCPDALRLAAYAEGGLNAAARDAIEQHLVDCADCRAVLHGTAMLLNDDAMNARTISNAAMAATRGDRPRHRRHGPGHAGRRASGLAEQMAWAEKRPAGTAGACRGVRARADTPGRGTAHRRIYICATAGADAWSAEPAETVRRYGTHDRTACRTLPRRPGR